MNVRGRDVALALLLANLCFARVWSELVDYSPADSFFFLRPPPTAAYLALWANLFFWTIAIWSALGWFGRRQVHPILSNAAFFLACLIPLNALREILATRFNLLRSGLFAVAGTRGAAALIAATTLLFIVLVWRFGVRLRTVAVSALFLTTPLLAYQFAAVGWRIVTKPPDAFDNGPLRPFQEPIPGAARIVWIIFDEMDYRLSFPERPKSLQMPAFDILSREAVQLTDALPPANATLLSIPSLLHGATVSKILPLEPGRAGITYSDSPASQAWDSSQTVFSTARQLGYNSAVVGWYLPYCRVLNGDLSACAWTDMSTRMNSTGRRFSEILWNQNRSLFETSMLSPWGQSLTIRGHIAGIETLLRHAEEVVSDPRLNLIFLHFPVPHAPPVYDRFRQTMTKANSPISGYIDSLALADRILGQLREDMEHSGLWTSTTLLVTADHSFRSSAALDGKYDLRVPYLLKLANQSHGERCDKPFQTVRTRALLTSILQGKVHTSGDAIHWMEMDSRPDTSAPPLR